MSTIPNFVFRFLTIRSRITTTLIISLLLGFALSSDAWKVKGNAAPAPAAGSGYLYVLNDCNKCANRIFGFSVDEANGALTQLENFPILTGGIGTANGVTSELLTIDRKNLRLFAINDDSDTVSAFSIDPASGALRPMFNPINLPINPINPNTSPIWDTITVRPSGSDSLLVVGDIGGTAVGGRLASFKITATMASLTGTLTTGPGGANPLSNAFSQDGTFVYTGGGDSSKIAGFRISATGALTALSPNFEAVQSNPAAYASDAQGRFFAASRPFSILLVFTIDTNGRLIATPFNNSLLRSGAGFAAQGVLHPNGFYMVSGRNPTDKVSVHRINGIGSGTTLTLVGTFNSGGSSGINLLALNQSGRFLFAANTETHNLTTFVVAAAGTLTIQATQPLNTLCAGPTPCLQTRPNGIAYWPAFKTDTTIIAPPVTLKIPSFGQTAPVTVKVTSVGGTPSGSVILTLDGGPALMTQALSGGSATFNILVPNVVVSHHLIATFPGSAGFGASSNSATLVVKKAGPGEVLPFRSTVTTIIASPITLKIPSFGQTAPVIVNVTSTGGTPSGTVSLRVDGGAVMTRVLIGGSATFDIVVPKVGDHFLLASFPGQAGVFDSSSAQAILTVNKAGPGTLKP